MADPGNGGPEPCKCKGYDWLNKLSQEVDAKYGKSGGR